MIDTIPTFKTPNPIVWQFLADEAAFAARIAYIASAYETALYYQHLAARYAATARKEYPRWLARR